MGAKRRKRKKKKHNLTRLVFCVLVETTAVLILLGIIGWDHGLSDFFRELGRPVVRELDLGGINSSCAVLMQADGGKIIGECGGSERIYPASMTKMMTALVALENLKDPEQEITLTAEMFDGLYEMDATQAGFLPDEKVRVLDLLYGVMLPSGAECCRALSEAVAGSEEAFAELMNQKAGRLGMSGTHFCNSTGLHDPEHYSTVKDMAVLLKYALRDETFREIAESPWHSTGPTNLHPDGITFYSTLFQSLPDPSVTDGEILGGKTGFTDEAGHCLASFAEIGGREYILVTAKAFGDAAEPLHVEDARTVYDRLGEAYLELEQE